MITANEFRIGNILVSNENLYWKIVENYEGSNKVRPYPVDDDRPHVEYDCKPVVLTSELLVKCGFDNEGSIELPAILEFSGASELNIVIEEKLAYLFNGHEFYILYPHYLHQLQNLYFALTGEELEVNL